MFPQSDGSWPKAPGRWISPITSKPPLKKLQRRLRLLSTLQKTRERHSDTNETFIILFSHYVQWATREKSKTDRALAGGTARRDPRDGDTDLCYLCFTEWTRNKSSLRTKPKNPNTQRFKVINNTDLVDGFFPPLGFICNTERFQTRSSLTIREIYFSISKTKIIPVFLKVAHRGENEITTTKKCASTLFNTFPHLFFPPLGIPCTSF